MFPYLSRKKIARQMDEVAERKGLSKSELYRAAALRYLSEEENEQLFKQMMRDKARQYGIRDEDDVEELVDSMRE